MTGLEQFADLFATRDSSLALAAAALVRIADDQGRASFSDLAVAYREEFLKLRAHAKGEPPDAGSLSTPLSHSPLRSGRACPPTAPPPRNISCCSPRRPSHAANRSAASIRSCGAAAASARNIS